jgi:hypothetical protein
MDEEVQDKNMVPLTETNKSVGGQRGQTTLSKEE